MVYSLFPTSLFLLLLFSVAPISAVLAERGQETSSGEEGRRAKAVSDTTGPGRAQAEAAGGEAEGGGGRRGGWQGHTGGEK